MKGNVNNTEKTNSKSTWTGFGLNIEINKKDFKKTSSFKSIWQGLGSVWNWIVNIFFLSITYSPIKWNLTQGLQDAQSK